MGVYNAEEHLRTATRSILEQSFADLELIAVNDGSTDRSAEILAELGQEDARVQLITQPNSGVARALDRAAAEARGQWIARMDADDWSAPDRLAKQRAYLQANPEIGVCGSWIRILTDGGPGGIHTYPESHAAILARLLLESPFCGPSVMLRRELFDRGFRYQGGYPVAEATQAEDYALWSKMAAVTRFANLPEPLFHYRRHAAQATQSKGWEQDDRAAKREIQAPLFARIGIIPSDEEWEIHWALGIWDPLRSRQAIARIEAWLSRIREANLLQGFFAEPELTAELSARWYRACSEAAPELGVTSWREFWRSAITRCAPPPVARRIRFALKCGLGAVSKRRQHR
jgi:glycosyltransferase involved in cell wall biosynthesis